jgi:adenylate cyclase
MRPAGGCTASACSATRIALHCGDIVLGNVGAADHFEYRAVGDIVNASSRLQELNKDLGTRILASQEMLEGIGGYAVRALGRFLLRGKTVAIMLYELMGRADQNDAARARLCERFAEGLRIFQNRRWDEAAGVFSALIAEHGEDGPSRYFKH